MTIDDLIKQLYGNSPMISVDGEDRFADQNIQRNASGLREWDSMFNQMGNSPIGYEIDPARRMQILQQMAQNGQPQNFDSNQFLNSQEQAGMNQWNQWAQGENAKKSLGDYMAMGAFGAGLAGMGGLAFGGFGAPGAEVATAGDAAWGVNPASSEFSLAGGAAGNASGGLYSGAGGVTGLTPGGAGVTGLTGTATGGALLTPTMAASIGLPASAAMGGSGLTAAQAMGGVGSIGGTAAGVVGGNALSRSLGLGQGATDALSIGGSLLGAGLGLYGAGQQANAYGDIANKFLDMGAPYRGLLADSYKPGFSMANQPDFMNALDIGSQAAARATSAKAGNPVGNPGAYADMQKYISGSLALPQLNTYRSQLGTFGQLGTNQAGAAMGNQVQSQGNQYDALGYGIGQLTQPDNPLKGLLDQFKGMNLNSVRSF